MISKINNQYFFLIILTSLLFGCGGGGSSSSNTVKSNENLYTISGDILDEELGKKSKHNRVVTQVELLSLDGQSFSPPLIANVTNQKFEFTNIEGNQRFLIVATFENASTLKSLIKIIDENAIKDISITSELEVLLIKSRSGDILSQIDNIDNQINIAQEDALLNHKTILAIKEVIKNNLDQSVGSDLLSSDINLEKLQLNDSSLTQEDIDNIREFDSKLTVLDLGALDLSNTKKLDIEFTRYTEPRIISFFQTEEIEFDVPQNTISFIINLHSENNGIGFASFTDPNGTEYITADSITHEDRYGENLIRPIVLGEFTNLMVPINPEMSPIEGKWKFSILRQFDDKPITAKVSLRTGQLSNTTSIQIQPYISSESNFDVDLLQPAFERAKEVYKNQNITAEFSKVIRLTKTNTEDTPQNFSDSSTSKLIQKGTTKKLNLFLIDSFEVTEDYPADPLGKTGGIPAPQGIKSNYNAVLISLQQHALSSSKINADLLGETIAHEMGHWMGLFHPSESNGKNFDPLADTNECDLSVDSNGNGQVDPFECSEEDRSNVMFWTSAPGIDQNNFTQDQIYIIKHTPTAK